MLPALRVRPRALCLKAPSGPLGAHGSRHASSFRGKQRTKKTAPANRQPKDAGEESQAKGFSLLEELFPEEVQRRSEQRRAEREVPRLAFDQEVSYPKYKKVTPGPYRSPNALKAENMMKAQPEETSVLVLRNASKSLSEEDFRRIIPKGKHIEGWNLEQGDILKIIPGRDSATLERQNYYILLFKSPLSAFTYQGRVTRLHKLAETHTASSLLSVMPPPPGMLHEGEDVHALLDTYALLPSSQKIGIRQLKPPLTPALAQIVQHQGYPFIVNRPGRSNAEVLLQLEGPQPTAHGIRRAIVKAERELGVPWTGEFLGDGQVKITKWEPQGRNVSPLSLRRDLREEVQEDGSRPRSAEGEGGDAWTVSKPQGNPTFILGFASDAEAERFVRYWHRRPLMQEPGYSNGDIDPVVNAEILW